MLVRASLLGASVPLYDQMALNLDPSKFRATVNIYVNNRFYVHYDIFMYFSNFKISKCF